MLALCLALLADPVTVERSVFGKADDGQTVEAFTLRNDAGFSAKLITLGATIQSLNVPTAAGPTTDVVLGFDDVAGYQSDRNPYFGCVVGRYANRIIGATFDLDGQTHNVTANIRGKHHIHGAGELSQAVWEAETIEGTNSAGVEFRYASPAGAEGFPAAVDFSVRYLLAEDANSLMIVYRAVPDAPTVLNLTNHSYFNLNGHDGGPITNHTLQIDSERFTEVDGERMPTGAFVDVDGTPYDFREPRRIGDVIETAKDGDYVGYDQNYVIGQYQPNRFVAVVAEASSPTTGLIMRVGTDEPAVQLYTPNMRSLPGKGGIEYVGRSSLCLETQHYPASPNHAHFPSTVYTPESPLTSRTIFAFETAEPDAK